MVYISTYKRTVDMFYISLESPAADELSAYATERVYENVTKKELEEIVTAHLQITRKP